MRLPWLSLVLSAGCVADTRGLDASAVSDASDGSDAAVDPGVLDTGLRDTGVHAVECCPVDPPLCGCVYVGGTKQDTDCPRVCDSDPDEWTTFSDENGCTVIDTGWGTCLAPPDAGVPSCDGVPQEFVGTWTSSASFVSRDSIEYLQTGSCAEIGWDQRLTPLTIEPDGRFSGRLVTDYLDTWTGCAVLESDGSLRLDVHTCQVTCYEHEREPGKLGRATLDEHGHLVVERRGSALLAVQPGSCAGCSNHGTDCEALENAYLRLLYFEN